jgi:glycosyltransferase involved in cell wall biosynthesis
VTLRLLAFPRDRENPYQELLYEHLRAEGDVVDYVVPRSQWRLLPSILRARHAGHDVFHVHWLWPFGVGTPRTERLRYWHFRFVLAVARASGYTLVWTVHNVLPHDPVFRDDASAARVLARSVDLVIAHSRGALEQLSAIGAHPRRAAVIEHGSYIGAYPGQTSRRAARSQLGLGADDFVYLFLGLIRSYKGIDELVAAYRLAQTSATRLVIAGSCSEPRLRRLLEHEVAAGGVMWHDGFVEPAKVQSYFAVADVAVLPYRRISTSGSALLAFSFGTPVITTSSAAVESVPLDAFYAYDGSVPGLTNALVRTREDPDRRAVGERGRQHAESLSWDEIARRTRDAIRSATTPR